MKLKTLAMSALLAFGLVMQHAKDYSGTYTQINNPKISFIFEKGKNGDY